ncbi:P-type conjugative transfer protein TrbJ [Cupriavidus basilensis]
MRLRNTILAGAAALFVTGAHAGAVAGSTEPTQILNNLELIMSTTQQAQMIANQLRNLQALGSSAWGDAQGDLMKLTQVVQTGVGISYAMENIDTAFQQKYPGYQQWKGTTDFGQLQRDWSASSMNSIRSALSAAGLQSQQFANERAALQSIQAMSSGSVGALQAIQAGSQIASQQVDQLQKLRQLSMAQINMQSNFMAQQEQEKQTKQAAVDNMIKAYTPSAPTFRSRGGTK